jgi:hypothetical protein
MPTKQRKETSILAVQQTRQDEQQNNEKPERQNQIFMRAMCRPLERQYVPKISNKHSGGEAKQNGEF